MGILADVYKNANRATDCTNNGWSNRFAQVCIVNVDGPCEPSETCPGVIVQKHRTMKSLHVVSVEDKETGVWTMAGGNFLYTSDSRFGDLATELLGEGYTFGIGAVSIHDRIE